MASKIMRHLKELAAATTDNSRHAFGNRMAGITDRVTDLADRLRNGRAGRMIGSLMDRFRSDDEKSSRSSSRRSTGTTTRSGRAPGKGAAGSRTAGTPSRNSGKPGASSGIAHQQAGNSKTRSNARTESARTESAAQAKRGEGSRSTSKASPSRAAHSRNAAGTDSSAPRTSSRSKKETGTARSNRQPQ